MFFPDRDASTVEMAPGLSRRVLATSATMMMVEFSLAKGAQVPHHSHPNDQVGRVISGKVTFVIGDETYEFESGDSYNAPSNIPHSAVALEPSVLVEVFSPPREDYA